MYPTCDLLRTLNLSLHAPLHALLPRGNRGLFFYKNRHNLPTISKPTPRWLGIKECERSVCLQFSAAQPRPIQFAQVTNVSIRCELGQFIGKANVSGLKIKILCRKTESNLATKSAIDF